MDVSCLHRRKDCFFVWLFVLSISLLAFPSWAVDTDGDGLDNAVDLDDDNDGIPDALESPPVVGAITAGNNTETPTGDYVNSLGVVAPFALFSGTPGVSITRQLTGVVEGTQVTWDQDMDVIYALDLVIQTPVNGILRSLRVGSRAPVTVSGPLNATKFITLTWPGGGTAVLSDPLGEITSHADGDIITSGTAILLDSDNTLRDSRWSLNIDLSNATAPVTLNYFSDATIHTAGIRFEGFAFLPNILTLSLIHI